MFVFLPLDRLELNAINLDLVKTPLGNQQANLGPTETYAGHVQFGKNNLSFQSSGRD